MGPCVTSLLWRPLRARRKLAPPNGATSGDRRRGIPTEGSMILVVGATGFLGSEICRRLIERGEKVRGLVRETSDPATVDRLRTLGVETVVGDLRDRPSLDAAVRDARVVVSTATTTRSRQPGDSIEGTDEAGQ